MESTHGLKRRHKTMVSLDGVKRRYETTWVIPTDDVNVIRQSMVSIDGIKRWYQTTVSTGGIEQWWQTMVLKRWRKPMVYNDGMHQPLVPKDYVKRGHQPTGSKMVSTHGNATVSSNGTKRWYQTVGKPRHQTTVYINRWYQTMLSSQHITRSQQNIIQPTVSMIVSNDGNN